MLPQPAESDVTCRCGAPTSPTRPGRCAAGHPLRGFAGALARRHGLSASDLGQALADAQAAFLAASIADDGGDVPTRRHALHEYRARLHVHINSLSDAIERFGLFDRRGRLRVAWLQRLEGLIATAQRIDGVLGLERRSRRLPTSLSEALSQAPVTARRDP